MRQIKIEELDYEKNCLSLFSCVVVGLFFAIDLNAQKIPQIDPNDGKQRIVVTDDNFVLQKATGPVFRRSITCEAWITTDGKLHCKTGGASLKSASVKFTSPTYSSTTPGGDGTSAGGEISRMLPVKDLVLGQDTYTWDISNDKYREKHSIILVIATPLRSGQIVLINKKVPAAITQ